MTALNFNNITIEFDLSLTSTLSSTSSDYVYSSDYSTVHGLKCKIIVVKAIYGVYIV